MLGGSKPGNQGENLENNSEAAEVLLFWFSADCENPDWTADHRRWYAGGESFDKLICERFGGLVERALDGELDSWASSPASAMALIILLDQFTRNIFRSSARAFAGDPQARAVVTAMLEQGFDHQLSYKERSFAYMPLEHSESLQDQNHCVALFEALLTEVPQAYKANIRNSLEFAVRHRDIIAQFGRFPHRNALLGRVASAEEVSYLEKGGARFGQ